MVHYFKFLAHQLTGWPIPNYCLFFFSLGVQLMVFASQPITPITALTFIGTTLGVLCVIAINSAKSINGWLGLLSGICFIIVGFSAKNYLSIGEQLSYMVTLDLPVLISASWNVNMVSKIRKFNGKSWLAAIASTLVVCVISAEIIGNLTNDPRPWFDALSFSISLTGGVICFLRYNNQYFWWLASGLAQLVLWFITFKQGGATVAMFINSLIYITNDVLAFTISPWYNRAERARQIKAEARAERSGRTEDVW
ncbi:MAG: hypothetical protein AJITA_00046 [Acetilactobacillus jinshanensis]